MVDIVFDLTKDFIDLHFFYDYSSIDFSNRDILGFGYLILVQIRSFLLGPT